MIPVEAIAWSIFTLAALALCIIVPYGICIILWDIFKVMETPTEEEIERCALCRKKPYKSIADGLNNSADLYTCSSDSYSCIMAEVAFPLSIWNTMQEVTEEYLRKVFQAGERAGQGNGPSDFDEYIQSTEK